jgi:hypothetical protein
LDDRFGAGRPGVLPSEAFRRQCFVSAFPDEPGVREMVDFVGADNVAFASDWPHCDLAPGTDPDWTGTVARRDDLDASEVALALDVNPRRWFAISGT